MTTGTNAPIGPERFAGWPPELAAEVAANTANPRVGSRLLLAAARAWLWAIRLAPGERLDFHRHVLDRENAPLPLREPTVAAAS